MLISVEKVYKCNEMDIVKSISVPLYYNSVYVNHNNALINI